MDTTDRAPTATATADPTSVPTAAPPSFSTESTTLARFHRALYDLRTGTRKESVRIYWLGDSHGQADFWSGELRRLFANEFGGAGPGFVHLGYKNYRHDDVRLDIEGKWRMRPKKPVGIKKQADGVFGLGGLMMSGTEEDPRVDVRVSAKWKPSEIAFDLCYRRTAKQDAVVLQPMNGSDPIGSAIKLDGSPVGEIAHHTFTVGVTWPASAELKHLNVLRVTPTLGVELCGLTMETAGKPGVVIDTLAINGARYGTMLAWDEAAWLREAERRRPDLVILELGTNEAGDANPATAKIEKQVGELAARARKANPDVDCIVISPTDRGDAPDRVEAVREATKRGAASAGCAFFDVWTLLGGKGAFAKLKEEQNPKVQPDGIHLTIRGYESIAGPTYDELLRGFDRSGWLGKVASK